MKKNLSHFISVLLAAFVILMAASCKFNDDSSSGVTIYTGNLLFAGSSYKLTQAYQETNSGYTPVSSSIGTGQNQTSITFTFGAGTVLMSYLKNGEATLKTYSYITNTIASNITISDSTGASTISYSEDKSTLTWIKHEDSDNCNFKYILTRQ